MRCLLIVALAFGLSACAAQPSLPPVPAAADTNSTTRPVHYRSALTDYQSRMPVEPGDWRKTNERIAPGQERKP